MAKIGNAAMRRSELAHFNKHMLIHELIRGSLHIADAIFVTFFNKPDGLTLLRSSKPFQFLDQ